MAINMPCTDQEDKAGETISTVAILISKAMDGITISTGTKGIDVQNGITIQERVLSLHCFLFYLLDSFLCGCEYLTGVKKKRTNAKIDIFVVGPQRNTNRLMEFQGYQSLLTKHKTNESQCISR